MPRSKASIRREKKRRSPEMEAFRNRIETFFSVQLVPPDVQYRIKVDLSKMTMMPYYHEDKGTRYKHTPKEAVKAYCERLIGYDIVFAEELFVLLSKQQDQSFRRLSPRPKNQKERKHRLGNAAIWEHPVPVNVTTDILLNYVQEKNLIQIEKYLDYITSIPQIAFPRMYDAQLNDAGLRNAMPEGWDWENPDCSPYARYQAIGVDLSELGIDVP